MGYIPVEHMNLAIENNITVTIFLKEETVYINNLCKDNEKICKIHIKIDTGFNRLGFKINKKMIRGLENILSFNNLYIRNIFSLST